jgi:hypothetical protein
MANPQTSVPELTIIGVFDPGVPNEERIVLRPEVVVPLNGYGIAVGIPAPGVGALPLFDNCFWFPEIEVSPPAWVILFTGPGKTKTFSTVEGENVLTLHWQRPYTIFGGSEVIPILFRVDAAAIGEIIRANRLSPLEEG